MASSFQPPAVDDRAPLRQICDVAPHSAVCSNLRFRPNPGRRGISITSRPGNSTQPLTVSRSSKNPLETAEKATDVIDKKMEQLGEFLKKVPEKETESYPLWLWWFPIANRVLKLLGFIFKGVKEFRGFRTQKVIAFEEVAEIARSSLGPFKINKQLVNDGGNITIINDVRTMIKASKVDPIAAKFLLHLAETIHEEVGDGKAAVVVLATELLKRAHYLTRKGVPPPSIVRGYRDAVKVACRYIDEKLAVKVENLGKSPILSAVKTSISSTLKLGDSDFCANLVANAIQAVKMTNAGGAVTYSVNEIKILKAQGKSVTDSYLLYGYALNTGHGGEGMPSKVGPAKIACLNLDLQKTKIQEVDIQKIIEAGANVVLTTEGIDDVVLKCFAEAGVIAVTHVKIEDMCHVAKATGATMVLSSDDIDSSLLGYADEVAEECIADDSVIMIKGAKITNSVSLILRGITENMLNDMEKAILDALSVVKWTLESNTAVPGGGAVECAASVYLSLTLLNPNLGTREELAISEFADALLIIPKVLAANASHDASLLVKELKFTHRLAQTKAHLEHLSSMGLNLANGYISNNLEAGIVDPTIIKLRVIQYATEAAIEVLQIDDSLKWDT